MIPWGGHCSWVKQKYTLLDMRTDQLSLLFSGTFNRQLHPRSQSLHSSFHNPSQAALRHHDISEGKNFVHLQRPGRETRLARIRGQRQRRSKGLCSSSLPDKIWGYT